MAPTSDITAKYHIQHGNLLHFIGLIAALLWIPASLAANKSKNLQLVGAIVNPPQIFVRIVDGW